jgi:hypothetical protein
VRPQFSEAGAGPAPAKSPVFAEACLLLGLTRMRFLAIAVLGFVVGCGSTLGRPDGGGGSTGGGGTGSGGAVCVHNGETYRPGSSVPSGDCNSCFCSENGSIAFDATYTYGDTGGFVAYEDVATLTPPTSYRYERTSRVTTPPSSSCQMELRCGWEDIYGPSDVMRAIGHPDVQAVLAMATPPTYGRDFRPVDGTIFQFLRADGHGFLAGSPCSGGSQPGGGGCVDAPAGVTALVNLLRTLDEQQLLDASCAALR